MRTPTSLSLLLLVSGALVGGCGGSGSRSSGTAGAETGGGAAAKSLTAVTADDVKSVDPALAYDTWSTAVVHACTRRLVDYDGDGKLVPDLAVKWEESADRKSYTFHLRPDAKYADGASIQAGDFVSALRRAQNPKTASPGASFYGAIAGMEAPDPQTLVLRLKAPEPTLLNELGMTFAAPLPEGADLKTKSSGPYRLQSFEPGRQVVLERNPHDAGNRANLSRITLQLRVEEPLQLTRFRSGEVDLLPGIPPAEYARVMASPAEKRQVVQGTVNQTWYFGMNVTRAPWNNPKIRRAALLAMNRRVHAELSGGGVPANGILPPHVPGYDPARKLPEQSLEQAKRLVAEAGYGGGVPKSTMWLAANGQYPRHAEQIRSDLAAAGIPVELKAVTLSQYLSGYRNNADCWYGGWYPDYPDAGNFLEPVLQGRQIPPAGSNAAHYNNPKVDALLGRAHQTPLGPQRNALYHQAEDLLLEDLPWIPLYFEVETRYFRPGVTGVTVHPVWRQMLTGISKG